MIKKFMVAMFSDESKLLEAVRAIRDSGIEIHDVHTPYVVHGLDDAMGIKRSRLALVTFFAGVLGLALAMFFQFWTSVYDWRVNVGGKPDNSTLAFIPVAFEITILFGGLATALAFFIRSRLYPGAKPSFRDPRVSDHLFAVVIQVKDASFHEKDVEALLRRSGAIEVSEFFDENIPSKSPVKIATVIALLMAGTAMTACEQNPRKTGFEFMPEMVRSIPYNAFSENPVTSDQLTMQAPPEGSIPRGFTPYHYGNTPEEAIRAGEELSNPAPATPENIARGKRVYENFCMVCHGAQGKGDGPLIPKFPNPPSFTSKAIKEYPDGRLFHVITRGSGMMPSHASQISPEDRWKLVRYLRILQNPPSNGGNP